MRKVLNKELRREIGYKIIGILKEKGYVLTEAQIDTVVDDENNVRKIEEAQAILDEKDQKELLAQEITNKEKLDLKGFARHTSLLMSLPKEGEDEASVYGKNAKILREMADLKTAKERVIKVIDKMYNTDITHMMPETEEEAIRLYKNHGADIAEAFNLKSIIENSGFNVSKEFADVAGFENKASLYISINDSENAVKNAACLFNAILPKDLPLDAIMAITTEVDAYSKELLKEGKTEGVDISKEFGDFFSSFMYSKVDYDLNKKINSFIKNVTPEGKSFFKEFNSSKDIYEEFRAGRTPELIPAKGISKALITPVERKDQRIISDAKKYLNDFRRDHEEGKASFIDLSKEAKGKSLSELIALKEIADERLAKKHGIWDWTFGIVHTIREKRAISRISKECESRNIKGSQLEAYHKVMDASYDERKIKCISTSGLTELPKEVYEAEKAEDALNQTVLVTAKCHKIDLSDELDESRENPVVWEADAPVAESSCLQLA